MGSEMCIRDSTYSAAFTKIAGTSTKIMKTKRCDDIGNVRLTAAAAAAAVGLRKSIISYARPKIYHSLRAIVPVALIYMQPGGASPTCILYVHAFFPTNTSGNIIHVQYSY